MADTTTTVYGFVQPEVGASRNTWGTKLNNNFGEIDDLLARLKGQLVSVAGTDTITATLTGVDLSGGLIVGDEFSFTPVANNTGAVTLNVNAGGAVAVTDNGSALVADDLVSGIPVKVRYDGTSYDIIARGDGASLNAASQTFAGNVSINGNTTLGDAAGDSLTINAQTWSAPNGFAVNTDELVLNASGNLGLNVTPSAFQSGYSMFELGAAGNCFFTNNTDGNFGVTTNASFVGGAFVYKRNAYAQYFEYPNTTGVFSWSTAPLGTAGNTITFTEGMRLTNARYFKASNTGTYGGGINGTFHDLTSNANSDVIRIFNTAVSGSIACADFVLANQTPNNTLSYFTKHRDSTAIRCQVYSNGGIANYQANDVNLSDKREKINYGEAKNYLDIVCSIPVRTYNYIDQNLEEDSGKTLGTFAQDWLSVAPEFVKESNWGTEESPKIRLGLYETDIKYALMKCIQELKQKNDDLTTRIEALEAK